MELVTVVKEFTFDSAHFLPNHPGKCQALHGHTYRLQVGVQGGINRADGMVIDFGDLSQIVKSKILDVLDHTTLNSVEVDDFPCNQPTAENMALWIRRRIQKELPYQNISFVRLWETPTSYAEVKNV